LTLFIESKLLIIKLYRKSLFNRSVTLLNFFCGTNELINLLLPLKGKCSQSL
jgi:hypothetical protein